MFHGLGALGVATALAGCGGGGRTTSGPSASPSGSTTGPTTGPTTPPADASEPASPAPEPAPDGALVAAGEVPVGGGVVLVDDNLVVVQPTAGTFLAYSATCTHVGTQVDQVDGAEIVCPDHGSRFSIADGAPVQGPAASPLGQVAVALRGDQVVLA